MKSLLLLFFICWNLANPLYGQLSYSCANAHSHNDYAQANPFFGAFDLQCGSIEADVYLKNGELMVAHFPNEIAPERTLARLYLQPLANKINEGKSYKLQLLIDLKTPASPVLDTLVRQLARFPTVFGAGKSIQVVVSGNMPKPEDFGRHPAWLGFDGRFGQVYSEAALQRVPLFSASFGSISRWQGKGEMPDEDRQKMQELIKQAHQKGKKIRFWGTPDSEAVWQELMAAGVDWIGSDTPQKLLDYFKK